ncbi:hypothetical protein [Rhizobium herbae]
MSSVAKGEVAYALVCGGPKFSRKKLEQLLSAGTLDLIKKRFSGKSGKKQVGMYLAEIAAAKTVGGLDVETLMNAKEILDWMDKIKNV